jgi:hypothetical protein
MSTLGECGSRDSDFYRRPIFRVNASPNCFKTRDLRKEEFLWCDKCKTTVAVNELAGHTDHSLFIGAAQYSVEDNLELTHAGD